MKCENLRQEFIEAVLSGPQGVSPEVQRHLQSCAACAGELASFQQTMTLLDQWPTPEPSPYFGTRLRARLWEQTLPQPSPSWLAWIRRPTLAAIAALLIAIGVGLSSVGRFNHDGNTLAGNDGVVRVSSPGTAVGDLQYLDKNADLFSEFDALDGQSPTE